MKQSRLLAELQETTQGLYEAGIINKSRLQEYAEIIPAQNIPKYTSDGVKALRSRLNVSQTALAMIINTSPATIRAWELGTKKPGGPCCKLLHMLNTKGVEALL